MPLKLVDVYLADASTTLELNLEDVPISGQWEIALGSESRLVRFLLEGEDIEPLLEQLQHQLDGDDGNCILVINTEAALTKKEEEKEEEKEAVLKVGRISREELYQDVNEAVKVNITHYALVLLSTIVAIGGLLKNSVAIVIGAMVIAPLIGPNIALALATTLGDWDLLKRATQVSVAGLLIGLAVSLGAGFIFSIDPSLEEIASRTEINLGDITLALAAGVAGALSMTRGVSATLIGVMVAVALMPPLVACGLLLGSGHIYLSYKAVLLLISNVAAINLSSVLTFLLLGLRPLSWYEAEKAKKATAFAVALWILVLLILITVILFL